MNISYNSKAKKFEIQCTFAENSMIAELPSKRFKARRRIWQATALSRNAEFLLSNPKIKEAMTPEAVEVAEKAMSRVSQVRREPFPARFRFRTDPFKHQRQALDHVWGLERYALFMEMGTGKTKVAIDLNAARMMEDAIDTLVVFCPNAIRDNWIEEWALHSPLQDVPTLVIGDLTKSRKQSLIRQAESLERMVVIVGMESLQQKHRGGSAWDTVVEIIGGRKYAVVVDESHLAKNPDANRARNVEDIASYAKFCGIMTGTPIAQGILDLYQQFQILDPDIIGIGDYYSFRSRYAEMGGYDNKQVVGYRHLDELMGLLKPYVYQCTKEGVLDLPEKLYTRRTVKMSKEQEKVYREIDEECETMVYDAVSRGAPIELAVEQILAKYNALQQVTGGFVNYDEILEADEFGDTVDKVRKSAWLVSPDRNPKVRELMAVAEEHGDKPIIVWAKFRNEIAIIVDALRAKYGPDSVAEYHGGISRDDRKTGKADFKDGRRRFFVANQQTGGTGLTINEASVVVYFSNSLKLVERLQSEDRNHRIGQKNDVLYIDLVCQGTKDVDVMRAIRDKKDVADYVRDSMAT
jgi:SNF2 family DNA or RNA helicase